MTAIAPHLDPARRHDAVLFFDVTDGNPNGDPDLSNQPRTDDETGQGLVTDVAIKRKIRDTVAEIHEDHPRYRIFVEAGHALSARWVQHRDKAPDDPVAAVCGMFFDVRMFGQVFTAGPRVAGAQVRGPVQVTFARSIDPILPTDHTITRVTQSRQDDIDRGERTEIGNKWTVPYGLYRANLFFSAGRARKTGVTSEDLAALWQAITIMFDHDRSAQRGTMGLLGLYVMTHPDALGSVPFRLLDDRIRVTATREAPRKWRDYDCEISPMPKGVELTRVVDAWS